MICHLRGKLIEKRPPALVIDVNGIGYEVQASMNTIYKLPNLQSEVFLLTQLIVREDAHILYGFADEAERLLFKEIIKTSGIGPKLALGILSGMDVSTFCECIHQKDKARLLKLPGIGAKTAERLIIEIHDRLEKQFTKNMSFSSVLLESNKDGRTNNATADAISGLVSLGYKPNDAERMILKIAQEDANSETMIKLALRELASK